MTIRNKQRRQHRDPVPWVGLSYRLDPPEIAIAGIAKTKQLAAARAVCRVGHACEAFPCCDAMGELIMIWLKSRNVSDADAIEAVRGIGQELLKVFA